MNATDGHDLIELPTSRASIACHNPATGEHVGEVPAATPEQVQQAVARARQAQTAWARSSFAQRRAVLRHMLEHILEHADDLCGLIVADGGKTWENALMGEVLTVANKLRWTIKYGEKHLKPERVPSGILMHKAGRIEYRPQGVVACIVPWNNPLQNAFGSLMSPLMAGNAVVVKPSEAVAWSTARLQRITDEALESQGFSPDIVQFVNGYGDAGAALVRSRVDKILFIGSVGNGRRIIEGSAEHLTPVIIEAGGKDPMIICEGAHLEHAVHTALGGVFVNAGQNCINAERLIVFDGIYQQFVDEVSRLAGELRQGVASAPGAVDVGAITSARQVEIIDELVADAIANGARALVGGTGPADGPGNHYPPTVLVDVTPEMRIANEEVFGPVMLILRVAGEDEAVALANATDFGLQSSVLSGDGEQAERIAARLQAGATVINDFGMCYLNQDLPFGGVKYSGFGRMNGRDGLRAYTNAKAVLSDRLPWRFPPRLYPVGAGDYAKSSAAIRLLFAPRWRDKLRHLNTLIRLSLSKDRSEGL